jgi:hypothetical protein
MRRKAKSKPRSKPNPPIHPTTEKEDSPSPPPQRKRLFHRYKANPKSKNPDGDNENPPTPASESPLLHGIFLGKGFIQIIPADIFAEKNVSDADTPQDGKGDPNLSGITPPLPIDLVEPQLQAHDMGFHVITAGIEVGITTIRFICFTLLAVCFFTFSQRYCRFAPRLSKPIDPDLLHLETSEVVLQRMLQ